MNIRDSSSLAIELIETGEERSVCEGESRLNLSITSERAFLRFEGINRLLSVCSKEVSVPEMIMCRLYSLEGRECPSAGWQIILSVSTSTYTSVVVPRVSLTRQ